MNIQFGLWEFPSGPPKRLDGRRLEQWNRQRQRRRSRRNAKDSMRRARKYGVQFPERVSREVVWRRDGGMCGICHEKADPMNWHVDHIIPLSKDGAHTLDNLQVSHPLCNLKKGVHNLSGL